MTRSSGRSVPLLLAPAEGLGALWALLVAVQKYTLIQLFGHPILQNLSIIKRIQDGGHGSKVAATNRYGSH